MWVDLAFKRKSHIHKESLNHPSIVNNELPTIQYYTNATICGLLNLLLSFQNQRIKLSVQFFPPFLHYSGKSNWIMSTVYVEHCSAL